MKKTLLVTFLALATFAMHAGADSLFPLQLQFPDGGHSYRVSFHFEGHGKLNVTGRNGTAGYTYFLNCPRHVDFDPTQTYSARWTVVHETLEMPVKDMRTNERGVCSLNVAHQSHAWPAPDASPQ